MAICCVAVRKIRHETFNRPAGDAFEYEFRFMSEGMFRAVHIVGLQSDDEACERAWAYLDAMPEFDCIIVRCGTRFSRQITYAEMFEEASPYLAS